MKEKKLRCYQVYVHRKIKISEEIHKGYFNDSVTTKYEDINDSFLFVTPYKRSQKQWWQELHKCLAEMNIKEYDCIDYYWKATFYKSRQSIKVFSFDLKEKES